MSDDEDRAPMDPMDESDDGMDDFKAPNELPDGVKKEILTEAPSDNWKKPKAGDEVTVHYVGTLESDGSKFDSSRDRDEPFVFTLGKGNVIKGWDYGVATMKKGEVAKLTLASEYAYGDSGSPPKIPAKATLVFEVELISWASKDDLFGDEGVVKTLITEGSGWKTPKLGDEVLVSVKTVDAKGALIEEKADLEYVLGSTALGSINKACDKVLVGMKKGETAELACTEEYAFPGKGPVTITVSLKQLYEIKDVSFAKDGTVKKKQVQEGEGYDTPKDASKVKLVVEAATDGTAAIAGFQSQTLEFAAGNGEVCDAIECAVCEMKKGEKAVVTVSNASLAQEAKIGLGSVKAEKVVLTLALSEFEKAKDTWSMSEEEKLEFGTARKEVGTSMFKAGRLQLALQRYKKIVELFGYVDNWKEENKTKALELKKSCELNKSACYVKLENWPEAKTTCNSILKDDKKNVKALYRLAQAELAFKNYSESIAHCKTIIDVDPQNRDARALHKQALAGQKEVDKQAKGMFANMCKALGKGPIPEPGKAELIGGSASDDENEADGDKAADEVAAGGA